MLRPRRVRIRLFGSRFRDEGCRWGAEGSLTSGATHKCIRRRFPHAGRCSIVARPGKVKQKHGNRGILSQRLKVPVLRGNRHVDQGPHLDREQPRCRVDELDGVGLGVIGAANCGEFGARATILGEFQFEAGVFTQSAGFMQQVPATESSEIRVVLRQSRL